MTKLLTLFIAISTCSFAFSQSFEGKLTYLSKYSEHLDTNYVYIRGDSVRVDLAPRLNVSTYLYFVGKKLRYHYSKRDQTYFSYPLIHSDSPSEVLAYELKNSSDSITLHYREKRLNLSLNVETIIDAVLKLHPLLKFPFSANTSVEHLVLNGSGYIAQETNVELHFSSMLGNEKRTSTRKLIHIDYTKPEIALFGVK